jgi:hypothetical protein
MLYFLCLDFFQNFGYFGNYGFSLGTSTFAIFYLILIAKEPLAKKSKTCLTTFDPSGTIKKKSLIENLKIFFIAAIVGPLRAMLRLFTCPRDTLLKVTILLLLFCYAIYSLAFQVMAQSEMSTAIEILNRGEKASMSKP